MNAFLAGRTLLLSWNWTWQQLWRTPKRQTIPAKNNNIYISTCDRRLLELRRDGKPRDKGHIHTRNRPTLPLRRQTTLSAVFSFAFPRPKYNKNSSGVSCRRVFFVFVFRFWIGIENTFSILQSSKTRRRVLDLFFFSLFLFTFCLLDYLSVLFRWKYPDLISNHSMVFHEQHQLILCTSLFFSRTPM